MRTLRETTLASRPNLCPRSSDSQPNNLIAMVPVAMLLLDHNLPHQLRDLLATFGLESETAASRGWERLRNSELLAAVHAAGFDTIFTRDLKFADSASKSLRRPRRSCDTRNRRSGQAPGLAPENFSLDHHVH